MPIRARFGPCSPMSGSHKVWIPRSRTSLYIPSQAGSPPEPMPPSASSPRRAPSMMASLTRPTSLLLMSDRSASVHEGASRQLICSMGSGANRSRETIKCEVANAAYHYTSYGTRKSSDDDESVSIVENQLDHAHHGQSVHDHNPLAGVWRPQVCGGVTT